MRFLIKNIFKHPSLYISLVIIFVGFSATRAFGALYSPGETLNPSCLPTDSDCGVNVSSNLASTTVDGLISTTTQIFGGDKHLTAL